ncbi:hypothetical protein BGZ83_007099 [Gryganskiella cystojenkinii]|nr:hypothetical protein BGZ83_007099 [Gryganskiella cystojenkinii]
MAKFTSLLLIATATIASFSSAIPVAAPTATTASVPTSIPTAVDLSSPEPTIVAFNDASTLPPRSNILAKPPSSGPHTIRKSN